MGDLNEELQSTAQKYHVTLFSFWKLVTAFEVPEWSQASTEVANEAENEAQKEDQTQAKAPNEVVTERSTHK